MHKNKEQPYIYRTVCHGSIIQGMKETTKIKYRSNRSAKNEEEGDSERGSEREKEGRKEGKWEGGQFRVSK